MIPPQHKGNIFHMWTSGTMIPVPFSVRSTALPHWLPRPPADAAFSAEFQQQQQAAEQRLREQREKRQQQAEAARRKMEDELAREQRFVSSRPYSKPRIFQNLWF